MSLAPAQPAALAQFLPYAALGSRTLNILHLAQAPVMPCLQLRAGTAPGTAQRQPSADGDKGQRWPWHSWEW